MQTATQTMTTDANTFRPCTASSTLKHHEEDCWWAALDATCGEDDDCDHPDYSHQQRAAAWQAEHCKRTAAPLRQPGTDRVIPSGSLVPAASPEGQPQAAQDAPRAATISDLAQQAPARLWSPTHVLRERLIDGSVRVTEVALVEDVPGCGGEAWTSEEWHREADEAAWTRDEDGEWIRTWPFDGKATISVEASALVDAEGDAARVMASRLLTARRALVAALTTATALGCDEGIRRAIEHADACIRAHGSEEQRTLLG